MHRLEVEDILVQIGEQTLLKDISLQLETGQIKGLVGHNGAGKSTLLRTIMGMQAKKAGKIFITGEADLDEQLLAFKQQIAYLPEEPLLLTELTVKQHFQLYGMSYRLPASELEARIARYVDGFELTDRLDQYPEELSKGMRQKAQTICAFLPEVPFLLIDEPFMGLDIYAIDFLKQTILEKAKAGTGILLTTHQLDQVKELADKFMMLQQGELIKRGNIAEFDTIQRGSQS